MSHLAMRPWVLFREPDDPRKDRVLRVDGHALACWLAFAVACASSRPQVAPAPSRSARSVFGTRQASDRRTSVLRVSCPLRQLVNVLPRFCNGPSQHRGCSHLHPPSYQAARQSPGVAPLRSPQSLPHTVRPCQGVPQRFGILPAKATAWYPARLQFRSRAIIRAR